MHDPVIAGSSAGKVMLKPPPRTTHLGVGAQPRRAICKMPSSLLVLWSSSSSQAAARACQPAPSSSGGRYALRNIVCPTCNPMLRGKLKLDRPTYANDQSTSMQTRRPDTATNKGRTTVCESSFEQGPCEATTPWTAEAALPTWPTVRRR